MNSKFAINKTVYHVAYYNIGNFLYLGAQWIISIVLVRMGGLTDAGLFSLAMSVCNMFSMIANYGLRSYQVSDIKSSFDDGTYVLSRIITVVTAFVLCVGYTLISSDTRQSLILIAVYMLYKCIEAYSDVLTAISQKNGKIIYSGISLGLKGILNLLLFLIAYRFSGNLTLSVIVMTAGSLFVLLLFDFPITKNYCRQTDAFKKFDIKKLISLLCVGLWTMLYVFSATAFNSIPKLILKRLVGVDLLGIFSSISVPTVLITTFAAGIQMPIAPKMADYYSKNQQKKLGRVLFISDTVIVFLGILAIILSFFIGKPIFRLIYGEVVIPYFNLLYFTIIASTLIAVNSCYSVLLVSVRKLKQLLAFSVSACVLVLILSLVLIPKYSIYGAAYAMIIASGIQFIAETVYILKIILSLKKTENEDEKTDSPCAIVTGCTGSVGVSLINKLVCEGYTVFAVLNPESKRNSNVPENEKVKKIFCGIDEYQKLPEMINEKCSVFFHLAWAGTFGEGRNDVALQQKNIEYSLDAVKAAKALGCEVFVGVGSQAEYGRVDCKLTDFTPANPENEYGKAKLIASQRTKELCNELGIHHEWTRLLSVYGPFDHEKSLVYSAISQLKSGICPEYTPAEQIWDLLYCSDAANAIYLVAKEGKPNETYVIGSGEEKPLKEYIETIHRVVNPDIKPVFGQRKYGENQVMYLCADIKKLENDTSYKQEIPFEEGIKRMAKEIK
ncbi:MAG: NAD-dependent epimerase/dehydratase family protein [Clostridia bacterium]|nr:NAD-dependent epimerase/dehydratase family protein [Clostridia bacterium]